MKIDSTRWVKDVWLLRVAARSKALLFNHALDEGSSSNPGMAGSLTTQTGICIEAGSFIVLKLNK